jgi:hypothetical protein
MQSTLLLSLRGPDTHRCPEIKKVQRWLRGLVLIPGNPHNAHEFMTATGDVPPLQEKGPLARELEFCSQHFYSHLMHGLEVVAYKHSDGDTRRVARSLFIGMCLLMHLVPETEDDMDARLRNMKWPGGVQPLSYEEVPPAQEEEFTGLMPGEIGG